MTRTAAFELQVAERVCTQAEIAVLAAKAAGYGRRRGSLVLGISEDAWRYRLKRALAKIERERTACVPR